MQLLRDLYVSIPEWFDLKVSSTIVRTVFDLVSIPEWFDLKKILAGGFLVWLVSFNSWMVRFKDVGKDIHKFGDSVSIPEWFDLKWIQDFALLSCSNVSIPEWFDLKGSW